MEGEQVTNEADALLMGSGGKAAKFATHGDQVVGIVIATRVSQRRDFKSKALKYWDDGNPQNELIITLQTGESVDEDDDGLRRVYAHGRMLSTIGDAVRKTGAEGLRPGGKLFIRYVKDGEPASPGMSGAKLYIAKYEPPAREIASAEEGDLDDLPF